MGPMAETDSGLEPVLAALDGEGPRYTSGEVAERAGLDARLPRPHLAGARHGARRSRRAGLHRARRRSGEPGRRPSRRRGSRTGHPRDLAPARDDDVAARGGEPGDDRPGDRRRGALRVRARGAHRHRRRARSCRVVGESLGYVFAPPPARADSATTRSPAADAGAATGQVTVCFADMVGFTQLGEKLAPDELGQRDRDASPSSRPRSSSRRCGW